MKSLLNKLKEDNYLSAYVILSSDILLACLASCATVLTMHYAFPTVITGSYLLARWVGSALLGAIIGFYLFDTFHCSIRHSSLYDMSRLVGSAFVKTSCIAITMALTCEHAFTHVRIFMFIMDCFATIFLLFFSRFLIVFAYKILSTLAYKDESRQRILIVGIDNWAISSGVRIKESTKFKLMGYLAHKDTANSCRTISGEHVNSYETEDDVLDICKKHNIQALLFNDTPENMKANEHLITIAKRLGLKTYVSPSLERMTNNSDKPSKNSKVANSIREVRIEDLLGRPEIKINMEEIIANFKDKVVMVTGAAGSIGSELCRQLSTFGIKLLVLYDNAETPMHNLRLELEEKFPDLNFVPIIGDVRHIRRLQFVFSNYHPQVVFHAAAYKHVPLMEENPCEAVLANVIGTRNVANKCIEYDVEKMVMISTDKAVNPTNIMGCTKRLAEIYVQSLGLALEKGEKEGKTRFVTTRFGNVLGSNGSVIPRFREQIEKGGPVTVTHPDITRFFMTIPEACRLVMEAATMTKGNQIFVFDMGESVKIRTLATRMIELTGLTVGKDIEITYTGLRPGEKLYEEVLANNENTIPTNHQRIRIAKVREYEYDAANKACDKFEELSRQVNINDMVKLMKEVVPEFKSKNSPFEVFDK